MEEFFLGMRSLQETRAKVNLAKIALPDTLIVQEAVAYASHIYPTSMLKHCCRTYYWGALLAQYDNLELDAELFTLANLFHDLGLTDRFIEEAKTSCFTQQGGELRSNLSENVVGMRERVNGFIKRLAYILIPGLMQVSIVLKKL